MHFLSGKGMRRTDADHHAEHAKITSSSFAIGTSSDLRPTSTRIPGWANNGTRTTRDLRFPVLHKTGCESRLTSNRIYIRCFCNDKRIHREEKMGTKVYLVSLVPCDAI